MERHPRRDGDLDQVAAVISAASDHGAVVAALVLLRGLRRRELPCAWLELGLVGLPILVLNAAIKQLVGRERPEAARRTSAIVRRPTSSSFPSGHTLSAAASAVALPATVAGQAAGLLGVALVGWSRLRLRAHHPGDVVGGAVLGGLLGLSLRPLVRRASEACRGRRLAD